MKFSFICKFGLLERSKLVEEEFLCLFKCSSSMHCSLRICMDKSATPILVFHVLWIPFQILFSMSCRVVGRVWNSMFIQTLHKKNTNKSILGIRLAIEIIFCLPLTSLSLLKLVSRVQGIGEKNCLFRFIMQFHRHHAMHDRDWVSKLVLFVIKYKKWDYEKIPF